MSGRLSHIFLTRNNKNNLSKWDCNIESSTSILSNHLDPFYEKLTHIIPNNVSPNVLALTGLTLNIFAWQQSENYLMPTKFYNYLVITFSILMYMILGQLHSKHAKNTLNVTPLGILFNYFCDCIGNVLITCTLLNVCGIMDANIRWITIFIINMFLTLEHMETYAFKVRTKNQRLAVFLISGFTYLVYVHDFYCNLILSGLYMLYSMFYLSYKMYKHQNDYATPFGIAVCLVCQLVKYYHLDDPVSNGILFSTLSADLILAKMADRELHQLVPIMHIFALTCPLMNIPLASVYFILNILDIANYLGIPILNPIVNVYVSGYFDQCHAGHIAMFKKATSHGTRLIVGVHSDADSFKYKKKYPIDNDTIRIHKVGQCHYVDQVVPKCPVFLTPELIEKYNIHKVGMSSEYVNNDPCGYYEYPKSKGMLVVIERTDGISSTQIRAKEDEKTQILLKLSNQIEKLQKKI